MKNQILFATIGCSLYLLSAVWWTIVNIIGYEKIDATIRDIMGYVTNGANIVFALSLVVLFASLLNRQKLDDLTGWH